ncbi:MAG: purine-nucleoside phosphorylase [Desulfobacterales bacterium]|nr:purine-nucleoside phosphorylase [Desulfobacterales bacterium]
MALYKQNVKQAADFLKENLSVIPKTAIMTGTGLGESVASSNVFAEFYYKDIPNFPISTVESHKGKLLFTNISGKPVLAMQGRFHLYEGYSPQEVTFPIRVMQELRIKNIIITNAAGGLKPEFASGDIMVINDHINLTGENPLVGPNIDEWGPRFPDMSRVYDRQLADLCTVVSGIKKISLQNGIYAGLKGPSLETPAEIKYLKKIGADAVGFSTIQEVIASVHAGFRILGLSTITNVHTPDNPVPATLEEIVDVAGKAVPKLASIISHIVGHIHE